MTKQLNLLSGGQVIPTALHTEMQQSYLEYAMSVIVGRALPDVRDGLKPVHRRILYAMHELGLTPDRPYRKCARVVGDVLGKYHPHGDQAVYDALVRLVQSFSTRYPLLDGHGNFGSVDDDPAAAMRYTETRLSPIGHEGLLSEIGEETVNFVGNFDNSQQEPTVLPAQLPFLILNGSSGIAVGMATNIPPHNLGEVIDGLIALIDRPSLTDEQLLELIPGPDFPTGGEIVGQDGVREAYLTGRGSIPLRGIARMEELQPGRGRHRRSAIVVTELPYQVNKAAWIEKVAELVNQNKLDGIGDIRDESDREGMRVVIELKRESNPAAVLNYLYKHTTLQINYGTILLALVDGQPRQLTLRQLLEHFLQFREQTLTRKYSHELRQAENRLQVLGGLLTALGNLDRVIEILRNAADGSTAKLLLQEQFNLNDRQSDAVLAMPLRRLTGLERQNLQTEFDELTQRVAELQHLLSDRHELLKSLKKELRAIKRKHVDQRRTRVATVSTVEVAQAEASLAETETELESAPVEEAVLEFTQRGYVRRFSMKSFQRQRGKNGNKFTAEELSDPVIQTEFTQTDQQLLVLTRDGKAYSLAVSEVPLNTGRSGKGVPLVTLLPPAVQSDPEAISTYLLLPHDRDSADLLLLSQQGRMKRLALSEFASLTNRGLTAIKFKEGDELLDANLIQPTDYLLLATSGGRLLKFEVNDDTLPYMNRTTQGNQGVRLRRQETLVGYAVLTPDSAFLMISQQGYIKRLATESVRSTHIGEIGTQAFQFASKTDALIDLVPALPESELILLTTQQREFAIAVDQIPLAERSGSSHLLAKLEADEKITAVLLQPL